MKTGLVILATFVIICGCISDDPTPSTTLIAETTSISTSSTISTTTTTISSYENTREIQALELMDKSLDLLKSSDCPGAKQMLNESRSIFMILLDEVIQEGVDDIVKDRIMSSIQNANDLEIRFDEYCTNLYATTTTFSPGFGPPPSTIIPKVIELDPVDGGKYVINLESRGCVVMTPLLDTLSYGKDGKFQVKSKVKYLVTDAKVSDQWGKCKNVRWNTLGMGAFVRISAECSPVMPDESFLVDIELTSQEGLHKVVRTCQIERRILKQDGGAMYDILDKVL